MVYKKNASTLSLESIRFSEGMYLKTESGFEINFFFKDHLGSVRAMVDPATQQIREQNDFYPFGDRFNSTPQYAFNPSNRYRYNEKEIQTTGNLGYIDYGWRTADPIAGRWISIDPLVEKYYSLSPYTFTGNNPVNWIDPDGRQAWPHAGKLAMGYDNYIKFHEGSNHLLKEQIRGSVNSILTVLSVFQIISGQIASNFTENKENPQWSIPLQWNEEDKVERKESWMKTELSWKDEKDVIKNTIGAILLIYPFSNAASSVERTIQNTSISTMLSIGIELIDSENN